MIVTCASCGTANRADRKFCSNCGSALAVVCPSCSSANLPGERFCGECGSSLAAGAARESGTIPTATQATAAVPAADVPTAQGPVAERRLVSVLFADLVSFTTLAEAHDPEFVREILSAYFDAARGVVERYGGSIEKFIGDAVMAVWGAPSGHEDDAERAVRAALELVESVAALGVPLGVANLQARAAVMTGEAAVTLGAVGEGLVAGDLVNAAARLQAVAGSGSVLVGEQTQQATGDSIAYAPAGEHVVKGKSLPIAAWRALRVVAGRRGFGRNDQLEAPFVGRATELRALKDSLAATGAERRARFVLVTGQAGIGKSRLAWELEKYVDGLVEAVYWHRGRSPSYGEGIAFWALAEMVRSRAGIAETDSSGPAAEKLGAMLADFIADADERRWIEAHLRVLLGLDEATGGDRNEQWAAWRRLFEAIAERGTTVLVFEDVQWADDGLLDFIESLFEWSRTRPILVIGLSRPELLERRPGFGQSSRNTVLVHLEPLTADEMRELLEGLAPDLDAELVDGVVRRAEGVPLYALELVRMLAGSDGTGGADVALAIPPSLRALVAARLDGQDPTDRSLLQDAAVLGQAFTLSALSAVSGRDVEDLDRRLSALVRREFLVRDVDPRSPERGQYAFVQGVVREVAYSTLSRKDRRVRHLAAARYFEGLDDDTVATILATHYLEAYHAAPDDEQGRAIRSQARIALRASADRSSRLHNYGQAVRDLGRALELADDDAERAAVMFRQAELSMADAKFDDTVALAERAREAYVGLGDDIGRRQAIALVGQVELLGRDERDADKRFREALDGLDPTREPAAFARFASELARVHMRSDAGAEGAMWAERALEAAGPLRLVEVIAEAINTRGVCLQSLGRLDEGIALIRAAADLAAANGLSAAEIRARFNLAGRMFADDPLEAASELRRAFDLALRTGRREWLLASANFLAGTRLVFGDLAGALAVLDEVPAEIWAPEERADAIETRAQVAAYRGDASGHDAMMVEARTLAGAAMGSQRLWSWALDESNVALAEGRLDDAARLAEQVGGNWAFWRHINRLHVALRRRDLGGARLETAAEPYRNELGRTPDVFRKGAEAGIALLEGRRETGLAILRDVRRRAADLGVEWLIGEVVLDAINLLGPTDPEVATLAAEARAVYQRTGDNAHLARLDEALEATDDPGHRPGRVTPAVKTTTVAS
ncbi:MAG TPA: AAA family ATPase [Candidatus Limnocylindrales bacterium]|nr:AAA family ATPase [Candidatus Limnocylindrales bacterium]